MNKLLLILSLIISNTAFCQLKKVELTPEEVQFIAKSHTNSFFSSPDESITNSILALNTSLFIFEISSNDVILYRGGYNLWNPYASIGQETYRNSRVICFPYNKVSNDTLLSMLENGKWKINTTGNTKLVCNQNFELFTQDSRNRQYVPATNDKLQVKFFRLEDVNP